MRKLLVFNSVTVDGYFTDVKGGMSWAHQQDPEWNEFTKENAKSGGELLFGRVTYDLMKGFWPTPAAAEHFPVVAKQMNDAPKIVFSRTMDQPTWNNTRLIKGDLPDAVRKLKGESGEDLVLLGSGSIVSQLAPEGVIDEYQIIVNPIVLGAGRTMFDGVREKLRLRPTRTRTFANGNVLICYQPIT